MTDSNPTLLNLIFRLWGHFSDRRKIQFGLLLLLMVAASFAEVLSIGAILPFLGALTSPETLFSNQSIQPLIQFLGIVQADQLILPLTIVFCLAALLSGAMRLILIWAETRLGHAIGADFSINIYRRTLFQPYSIHIKRNSSEIIAGISNKANQLVTTIILPVMRILGSVFMLSTIMVVMLLIEPGITVGAFLGFGGIYFIVILFTKSKLSNASEQISRESNQVIKALQEGLGGIRDVLIDGTQATYCKVFRQADLPLRRALANVQIIGASPKFCIEALGMVLIAILAYTMSKSGEGLTNAIPVLGALALGAQRLLPVIQQSFRGWTTIKGGKTPLADALELLDQPLPSYADKPSQTPLPFMKRITLNNISFSYDAGSPNILKNIDLTILKGSTTGFIGTTGSGKSTLLDLIMGLLSPTEGELLIDDVVVSESNQRAWQSHIAHVPQHIFLSDSTIAENIAFGVPKDQIDLNLVKIAAAKAQINEAIESWDDAYDTLVGERGVRLSGGQRQRIGIARALYKKADVIIFDEATSALDSKTEADVMESISSLDIDLTIIIVAHRISTLKNCTQIISLENQVIKNKGDFESVVGQ